MIAAVGRSVKLPALFRSARECLVDDEKGGTASKSGLGSSEPGGQNNIEINPVFRGMVRCPFATDCQPMENCDQHWR